MIVFGLMAMLFSLFLIYNHRQVPTEQDVYQITQTWHPQVEEVLFLQKVDDTWLTIFRTDNMVMLAKLEQNWLGSWKLINNIGEQGTLASVSYPTFEEKEFTWSVSGSSPAYFFGQIVNNSIKQVKAETNIDSFEDARLLNEGQFFFLESDKAKFPVHIQGLSESGEVIYSTLK